MRYGLTLTPSGPIPCWSVWINVPYVFHFWLGAAPNPRDWESLYPLWKEWQ